MAYPKMNKKYSAYHTNLSARSGGKSAVKYIVIHYTGGSASAENNCIYFAREGAKTRASADYFIGTKGGIWKYNSNCKKYRSWHCGDGGGKYGITNNNSIGIEVVNNGSGPYSAKQIASLQKLVQAIQKNFGIPDSNIKRHWDASRKECPYFYRGNNAEANKRWKALLGKITD